jgi:hypothetical protein
MGGLRFVAVLGGCFELSDLGQTLPPQTSVPGRLQFLRKLFAPLPENSLSLSRPVYRRVNGKLLQQISVQLRTCDCH